MILGPLLGFLVKPLDVLLQLPSVDAPYASAPDLDRRQLSGPHQRVHLGDADAQIDRHVLVLVMSSALVVGVWSIASDRLIEIVSTALSNVCGGVGC